MEKQHLWGDHTGLGRTEASEQSEAQALRVKSAQASEGPGSATRHFHLLLGEYTTMEQVQLCFDIEMEIVFVVGPLDLLAT